MNGSETRVVDRAARSWRMRQWPSDPTVAHLILVDHQSVPTREAFDHALEHATRRGARAVRTSALFPAAAEVATVAGFEPIDRLALLERNLDELHRLPAVHHRVRTLRTWDHHRAAEVDRDAFGPLWGNTATSLRDIRRATPHHHAATVRSSGSIAGFAISGAAASVGYIQRVAVASHQRRRGIARDLVVDALMWMSRNGSHSALVNTGVTNEAALALYQQLGFERQSDELTIAELRL